MKWVALLLFILVGIAATATIRQNQRAVPVVAFLLGFLPFVMAPWHLMVAPYSIASWPGYVKGWEFGLIDVFALACLIGVPKSRASLPFKYPFLAYIAAASISVLLAPNFTIALAYPLQLARVFLVFAAVARLSASPLGLKVILQGLFVGLSVQAAIAIWSRLGGAIQTGGSFGHQNLLGFVSHLVFIPAFALLLSGLWTRWAIVGLISGAIVVVLTVSRATVAFAGVALVVTYLVSVLSASSSRKIGVGLATVALIGLSFPIIQYSFERRFATQGNIAFNAPDEEREAFELAAKTMIADHPLGVGANHYVVVVNTQGYASRAGVGWGTGSRATNVHNSFLLMQAETGYLGLLTIFLLLGTAAFSSLVHAFRARGSPQSDLLIGIFGALFAITLHSFYEWMLVTHQAQYLLGVILGVAAGLIRQLKAGTQIAERPFAAAKRRPSPKINPIAAQQPTSSP